MRPTLLIDTLKDRFAAHLAGKLHRAAYIVGPPGGGKTQTVRQTAKDLGVGFRVIHAPLMQEEDYGMPVVNAARDDIKFVVSSDKFPLVGSDCEETGILLVDEVAQADQGKQKILANLFQEREIHGHAIKPGWMIVANGNRQSDRAGANRILSHFKDRMTEYEYEVSLDDWCNWSLEHDVPVEVVSFIRFRPNLLLDFDPQREKNPTPRGWVEGVGAAIGTVRSEAEYETFKGDVGEGAAAEFVGFLKIFRNLPDPDVVLMNPTTHKLPTDPATTYALCGAIAARASKDNFERIVQVAERMSPEFMVLTVRDSIRRNREVQHTKAFVKWASGPGAKVLI
jgi:hypothetical protein